MAFGKKKDDPFAPAAPDDEPDEPLFPVDDSDESVGDADSSVGTAPATSAVTYGTELAPPEKAQSMAVGPPEENSDALLSMFSSSKEEEVDNSIVLELAGNVELADLLEDLQTLAAAMGIAARTD
jgi:hypothetical protein